MDRFSHGTSAGSRLSRENLSGHALERRFGQVRPRSRSQLQHFADRRIAPIVSDLFAGIGHHQLDFSANLQVKRLIGFILGIGRGWILVPSAKGCLDPATYFPQNDPFLTHFMIGQEAACQEGVPAVVDGQIGKG
jgi:hypothetical protein